MTLEQAIPVATSACLGLGVLAKGWPWLPNAYIPTLVAAAGAVVVPALTGWDGLHVVSGFIAGLGATGIHAGLREAATDIKKRRNPTD
jgi:hypothetical protein